MASSIVPLFTDPNRAIRVRNVQKLTRGKFCAGCSRGLDLNKGLRNLLWKLSACIQAKLVVVPYAEVTKDVERHFRH
jgi:hypothetical protein